MNGAENVTAVARTVRPQLTGDSLSSSKSPAPMVRRVGSAEAGALAAADEALNQVLDGAGFVDITAPFAESFAACIDYHPAETQVSETTPGALEQLMASLTSGLAAEPDRSVQTQARVPPEDAVRLLA